MMYSAVKQCDDMHLIVSFVIINKEAKGRLCYTQL